MRAREKCFQVVLGLLDVAAAGELPALRKAVDVRVHRERRFAKSLRHDHAGGLVPHSRQSLELGKRTRHLSAVLFDQDPRKFRNSFRLPRRQAARADDFLDFLHRLRGHFGRGVRQCEKPWGDFIHALVRALGRQQHGNEQRVGIAMLQRDGCFRVKPGQPPVDVGGAPGPRTEFIWFLWHRAASTAAFACETIGKPESNHFTPRSQRTRRQKMPLPRIARMDSGISDNQCPSVVKTLGLPRIDLRDLCVLRVKMDQCSRWIVIRVIRVICEEKHFGLPPLME